MSNENGVILKNECKNIERLTRLRFNQAYIMKIRSTSERCCLYQNLQSNKIYNLLKDFLIYSNQILAEIINLNLANHNNKFQKTIGKGTNVSNESKNHISTEMQTIFILRNQLSSLILKRANLNGKIYSDKLKYCMIRKIKVESEDE